MKKFIALFLAIISITVVICSCGNAEKPVETQTDTNGEIITTTTTAKQTTSNNSGKETAASTDNNPETTTAIETTTTTQKPDEPQDDKYLFRRGYPAYNTFWETPSRVILAVGDQLLYYSKATDEILPFCFDPLCLHAPSPKICFSYKFSEVGLTRGMQNLEYCSYNNRLYALRGEQLFSFKFDGSDLKLEYSFGEQGKEFENVTIYMGVTEVRYLHVYGQYVYMLHKCAATGNMELMRYNTKTSKMENLSEKANLTNYQINGYILGNDRVYISVFDSETKMFYLLSADLDLNEIKTVTTDVSYDINGGIFDGEKLYVISGQHNGEVFTGKLEAINIKTGQSEKISEISGKYSWNLLAVTDDYIYYVTPERKYIGYEVTRNGNKQEIYSANTIVRRMDKETGESTIVSSDETFEVLSLYIAEDIVLIQGQKYTKGEGTAKNSGIALYAADIDEYGNFNNMHKLVLDE